MENWSYHGPAAENVKTRLQSTGVQILVQYSKSPPTHFTVVSALAFVFSMVQ